MCQMAIEKVKIKPAEFDAILRLYEALGKGTMPAFSSTDGSIIWPKVCNGPTPHAARIDVSELSPLLRHLARIYTSSIRPDFGGRFFIDNIGAFWKPEIGERVYFREWDRENLPPIHKYTPPQTPEENRDEYQKLMGEYARKSAQKRRI
jgi:hypothetical protein